MCSSAVVITDSYIKPAMRWPGGRISISTCLISPRDFGIKRAQSQLPSGCSQDQCRCELLQRIVAQPRRLFEPLVSGSASPCLVLG